jgi:uncharacterized protein
MARSIFVNLPVANLEKSKAFFSALGFSFNPQFTDQNAACMVLSEQGFVMLLQQPFFKTFTEKQIADSSKVTEAIVACSCESRAEVDEIMKKALAAGAKQAMPSKDHGFMYYQTFYDLDGHHWEFIWMDPAAIQK